MLAHGSAHGATRLFRFALVLMALAAPLAAQRGRVGQDEGDSPKAGETAAIQVDDGQELDAVDSIAIQMLIDYTDNIQEPYGYSMDFEVVGAEPLTGVTVKPPAGKRVRLVEDPPDSFVFILDTDDMGTSFSDPPIGDYEFKLEGVGDGDSVVVNFDPRQTTGYAHVNWPPVGSTTVPLLPVFTWETVATFGDFIAFDLAEANTEDEIFEDFRSITDLSWKSPVVLEPGTEYSLSIYVETVAELTSQATEQGDGFAYVRSFGHSNEVFFETCPALGVQTGFAVDAPVTTMSGTSTETIGFMDITSFTGTQADIVAVFSIDPAYSSLDDDYDFRWVSILTGLVGGGTECGVPNTPAPFNCGVEVGTWNCGELSVAPCLGTMPAMDPSPGLDMSFAQAPFTDSQPFYFTEEQHMNCLAPGFVAVCTAGEFVRFADAPSSPCDTVMEPASCLFPLMRFVTYLTATSTTDPQLLGDRFCVLSGFAWNTDNLADEVCIVGEISASNLSTINQALSNSSPFSPDFTGWTALSGCALTLPAGGSRVGFWNTGGGTSGTFGSPQLVARGAVAPGASFVLELSGALGDAPAFLTVGLPGSASDAAAPAPDRIHAVLRTDADGSLEFEGAWPDALPGVRVSAQVWVQDPAAPGGFAASNVLVGTAP